MKIIAIIPARGGSKGVVNKNIRLLAGRPLIYYTIYAAKNSKFINNIIVSTDDEKITEVASAESVTVIKRPAELSSDESPTIDTVLHAIQKCKMEGLNPEIVILLQPTSPFRTSSDIDTALELFLKNKCDSIISVVETTHPPYWNMIVDGLFLSPLFDQESLRMRRQDLPKTYLPNGAIYIAYAETLENTHSFYCQKSRPYIMPPERSFDIDSEFDLLFAEAVMKWGR